MADGALNINVVPTKYCTELTGNKCVHSNLETQPSCNKRLYAGNLTQATMELKMGKMLLLGRLTI